MLYLNNNCVRLKWEFLQIADDESVLYNNEYISAAFKEIHPVS